MFWCHEIYMCFFFKPMDMVGLQGFFQSEWYKVFGLMFDYLLSTEILWTWTDLVSICIPLFDYSDYNIYIYFFYNLINLMIQSSHARWRTTTSIETENIFHPFPINRDVSSIYWQIRFSFHTASSMFTNTIVFHKNLSYENMTKLLWVTPVFCQKLFISHRCPAFPENKLRSC